MRGVFAMEIFNGRFSGSLEGDFVVFLIGARINRLSRAYRFLPVGRAMGKMQSELRAHPELGCLHIENWFGRTTLSLQYWRSFEHLEAYSRSADLAHLPAWAEFNKTVRDNGEIGIWHETYLVKAGEYEAIYGNMHRFGLGGAGTHEVLGKGSTAALRSQRKLEDQAPIEGY